jgi:hypothetical protein
MKMVDNGCLYGFEAGIHKRWRPNNLDSHIFEFGSLEEDADGGFADEWMARDGINDVAARGVRTKHSLNDGIVRFFEGAAGFIFVIEGNDVSRPPGCKVYGQRSGFNARMALCPEEYRKVAG